MKSNNCIALDNTLSADLVEVLKTSDWKVNKVEENKVPQENVTENRIKTDMKNELKKYMNQLNDDDEKSIPMANSSDNLYESF